MFPTEQFWNEKFQVPEFFYGKEPNEFLKDNFHIFKDGGKILSLGEGEGRNAFFLAKNNLNITASDASTAGLEKIKKISSQENLNIQTRYEDIVTGDWDKEKWDGIYNIFCHLKEDDRISVYTKIKNSLNIGGIFLTEMFSKEQLKYKSGGPANVDMLITLDELTENFSEYKIIYAKAENTFLDEGRHQGEGSVIRFIVQKI